MEFDDDEEEEYLDHDPCHSDFAVSTFCTFCTTVEGSSSVVDGIRNWLLGSWYGDDIGIVFDSSSSYE